jgi:uncharacterized phage protein (TIGR02218 family)
VTATLSSDFEDHLKRRSQQRCRMLRLDLEDGTVLGFTDHDRLLAFDLGDDAGEIDYRPDFGMQISNVQTGIGLDAGNYEVTFPIGRAPRPITRAAVAGGRFNRCEARLFEVVWSNLAAGPRKVMFGNSGEWRIEGSKAIAAVRDQRDRLNQTTGRQVQNQCDADYADQVECFATATEIEGTVATASTMAVTVSYGGGPYADGFFNRGTLIGLTGANVGLKAPIWSWNDNGDGTADIELFMPLVEIPSAGDTFTVRDGCARTRAACMAHDQIVNFRGFPDVPGHKALKPAAPDKSSSGGKGGGK